MKPSIQYDLYRIPFNEGKGGKAEPIDGASRNGMSNSFPKVSPDGRWIVYVQARNGQLMRPDSRLYIVPSSGGAPRRMKCNTPLMNSWHSFSPNGRWLVFSSKSRSPYTQLFLTHIDEDGNDSPAILIENTTAANRAANIPEFVNVPPDGIAKIDAPVTEYYRVVDDAAELVQKGQYEAALPELRRAQALNPIGSLRTQQSGDCAGETGKTAEAIREYEKAIDLSPDFAEAYNNLGNALARIGKVDEAVARYRKALELDPEYAKAHSNLGVALARMGKPDEAIPHLRESAGGQTGRRGSAHQSGAFARHGRDASTKVFRISRRPSRLNRTSRVNSTWHACWRHKDSSPRRFRILSRPRSYQAARDPMVLDLLGGAYAEVGKLEQALETTERALRIAGEQQNAAAVEMLKTRIAYYQSRMAGRKVRWTLFGLAPSFFVRCGVYPEMSGCCGGM